MGAEGIKTAAQISVLNNNYLDKLLLSIHGVQTPCGKQEKA